MSVVAVMLLLLALLLAVPTCWFFLQVLLSLPTYREQAMPAGRLPRIAVLVPAHDEAAVIGETLRTVRSKLAPGDRLLVVADNCSDDTAKLAAAAGAEVVERFDDRRRGKGYALDFGVTALKTDPPEVLIVVDADCDVASTALERIARTCHQAGRPVQALYLMRPPPDAGLGFRVSQFAWLVKNYVRPLGSHRIGVPCQLMGTGMAFPWGTVHAASMATGHITEDVLFGVNVALAGTPPLFCPEALVTSEFAASETGAQSQRRRWEHGHLDLIVSHAPRLFLQGLRREDVRLMGMALDLAVPPIALLTLVASSVFLAAAAVASVSIHVEPLFAAAALMVLLAAAIGLSWVRHGRDVVSLGQLAFAPVYVVRKIPMYIRFLTKRQVDWVRTRRGG